MDHSVVCRHVQYTAHRYAVIVASELHLRDAKRYRSNIVARLSQKQRNFAVILY